jgi:hypothetical protein
VKNKQIILTLLLGLFIACESGNKFDTASWQEKDSHGNYSNRGTMLDKLLKDIPLKGLSYRQLINLLGEPSDVLKGQPEVLYYLIEMILRPGDEPDYIKSLAIQVNADSIVIKVNIIETGKRYPSKKANSLDSATANWKLMQIVDSGACFQKQYAGIVNGKRFCFNLNLRAINIRAQKDLIVWAQMDSVLQQFYCSEAGLYGREEDISPRLKYLLGYANNDSSLVALKFNSDSSSLNVVLVQPAATTQFVLHSSRSSLPTTYQVSRFYTPAKYEKDSTVEAGAAVILGVTLPAKTSKWYNSFLMKQVRAPSCPEVKGNESLDAIIKQYEKAFCSYKKRSRTPYSRFMNGYNNAEVIYNQDRWVVLRTEKFESDEVSYGDMTSEYLSFNIKQGRMIEEKDVLVSNWRDSLAHRYLGFAFVCPIGVGLRVKGNHGWDVEVAIVKWAALKPVLKKGWQLFL